MKVPVLLNRGGGAVAADGQIAGKVEAALQAEGIEGTIELIDGGDYAVRCRAIAERGDPLVIVGGGDGTIGAAASALVGTETRLGILPLGTLNHFARDAGIPTDLEGAVDAIANGVPRRVDIAEVNGKVFVNNSSVGLYPHMVRLREAQQAGGRSKRLAMLSASLATLRSFRKHRLRIHAPGLEAPIETPLLFIGNNRYQVNLFGLGQREAIDQGELCLYAVRAHNRARLLWAGLRGIFGRLDQQRDFVTAYVTEAEIASDRARLGVATDGEQQWMETPLVYRVRPGALTIMVPAER